jgi:hypothetical protein
MNLVFGNIQLTEEAYEELAREWRVIGDQARNSVSDVGIWTGQSKLKGFETLADKLGIMPGIRRADERLQRQEAA